MLIQVLNFFYINPFPSACIKQFQIYFGSVRLGTGEQIFNETSSKAVNETDNATHQPKEGIIHSS